MNLNSYVPGSKKSPLPVIGSTNSGTPVQFPLSSCISRTNGSDVLCVADTGTAIGASADISIIIAILMVLVVVLWLSLLM